MPARAQTNVSQTFGGGWRAAGNHCLPGAHDVAFNRDLLMPISVPHSVLALTAQPLRTVMSVGDSILCGEASWGAVDSGISGPGFMLARLLDDPQAPALHVNCARAGMTTADFVANAWQAIDAHTPDIVLLQTYSANDPDATSREVAWTAWCEAMRLASHARARGSCVILVTSPPFCGRASARDFQLWEETRLFANELIMASGQAYIDSDAVVGTGGGPVDYAPGCCDDGIHPNATGSARLAAAAAAVLQVFEAGSSDGAGQPEALLDALGYSTRAVSRRLTTSGQDLWRPPPAISSSTQLITLLTVHGTVVYADTENGRLRHGPASLVPWNLYAVMQRDSTVILCLRAESGLFSVGLGPGGPWAAGGDTTARVTELELVQAADGGEPRFGFRAAGLYLCAEPWGDVALNRPHLGAWETFKAERVWSIG